MTHDRLQLRASNLPADHEPRQAPRALTTIAMLVVCLSVAMSLGEMAGADADASHTQGGAPADAAYRLAPYLGDEPVANAEPPAALF